jgi:dihydroorotate dehydrogenase electron transfer subunit
VTGPIAGATGELVEVTGTESIGPYTLLRIAASGIPPGVPGQFFMLHPPGHVLPRPMSLCLAKSGELCFLIDAIGPGTRTLSGLRVGERLHVLGPLGNGFDLTVPHPLIVGGGIGIAPFPYVAQVLGSVPAVLGFRSAHHAEAAALLAGAEVVLDPVLVTSLLPDEPVDVLACGPEPMLEAVRARVPRAQLAWEAPMACGYGACYGCVVEVAGRLQRLCIAGPVLRAA